jgi:hypothetical protein
MPAAAFINAIAEEGTKAEAIEWLQKEWDENCHLRKLLRDGLKQGDFRSPHWWGDAVRKALGEK